MQLGVQLQRQSFQTIKIRQCSKIKGYFLQLSKRSRLLKTQQLLTKVGYFSFLHFSPRKFYIVKKVKKKSRNTNIKTKIASNQADNSVSNNSIVQPKEFVSPQARISNLNTKYSTLSPGATTSNNTKVRDIATKRNKRLSKIINKRVRF